MHQGARGLIEALTAAATMDEVAARDFASAAEIVAQAGSPAAAQTLRALSGIHERRAGVARAQLVVLSKSYGHTPQGDGSIS
jgi:hypothetical protein